MGNIAGAMRTGADMSMKECLVHPDATDACLEGDRRSVGTSVSGAGDAQLPEDGHKGQESLSVLVQELVAAPPQPCVPQRETLPVIKEGQLALSEVLEPVPVEAVTPQQDPSEQQQALSESPDSSASRTSPQQESTAVLDGNLQSTGPLQQGTSKWSLLARSLLLSFLTLVFASGFLGVVSWKLFQESVGLELTHNASSLLRLLLNGSAFGADNDSGVFDMLNNESVGLVGM